MSYDEYKKQRVGKRIDYDMAFGYQCVDLVKHFADQVLGQKLGHFSGSALNGWKTGTPFINLPFTKVTYKFGLFPPRGSIVFFNKTVKNPYGHVAVAGASSKLSMYVMEQNALKGSGTGLNGDQITIREYPYKGARVGDVLGWYVLN